MADPMSDERLAEIRRRMDRITAEDDDWTLGDYHARDLLAEVERLRADLSESEGHFDRLSKLYVLACVNAKGLREALIEADKVTAGLREQVKRVADEAEARAARTVHDDPYEYGQSIGLRTVAAALREALTEAGLDPARATCAEMGCTSCAGCATCACHDPAHTCLTWDENTRADCTGCQGANPDGDALPFNVASAPEGRRDGQDGGDRG